MPQYVCRRDSFGSGNVSGEMLIAGSIGARQDVRVAHTRQRADGAFDFARFDAVAAHLDLAVQAAEKFEHAVRAPSHAISGAIDLSSREIQRVRYE
jgi:hypothetical protein